MDTKRIREIEAEIAELKARWPAHSVPPRMWQPLEELEEKLEEAKGITEAVVKNFKTEPEAVIVDIVEYSGENLVKISAGGES